VAVDAGDNGMPRGLDGRIDGGRDLPGRIVHHRDPWIRRGYPPRDFRGVIAGRPQGQDQLKLPRIVLAEDMLDRLRQVHFLI
jgi:hypothetical protein